MSDRGPVSAREGEIGSPVRSDAACLQLVWLLFFYIKMHKNVPLGPGKTDGSLSNVVESCTSLHGAVCVCTYTYLHHGAEPDSIIVHDLLRDREPGDVTLAAEVQVTHYVVFDVLDHLGEDGFSVRHRLADLRHPVLVVFLLFDFPRSVSAGRAANLLGTVVYSGASKGSNPAMLPIRPWHTLWSIDSQEN